MKSIKFLAAALFLMVSVSVSAQKMQYVKTSPSGKSVAEGRFDTLTTFNATPVIMDTMAITDNSAGIIEVTAVGASAAGDGITGKLVYRYHKASGTLTVATADTISTITADTGLSGGTFALAATSYGNTKLTVTGKASVTVRWRSQIKPFLTY